MIEQIKTGWNLIRVVRLIIGVAGIVAAILGHDPLLGFAGGILVLMAVLNMGCCGVAGCQVPGTYPGKKSPDRSTDTIHYEEVGSSR